ncbi:SsgA family sporulation/cell division regulator [Kitasatospora sp. NPDC096147]|uniref:SsgA family sporulation/cell division regulator n=1 Tax=Kitasatospora sp. NPDC096147 TaxID=3364093 RepID=UPI0037FA37DB
MTHRSAPRVPAQRTSAGGCVMPLGLALVAGPGVRVPVTACLRYSSADPYAVHLDFHLGQGMPVRWTFARELLATGLHGWAGTGDVSVFPGTDQDRQSTCLSLDGDTGTVLLLAPTTAVRTFLGYADRLVPPGTEQRYVDLEGLLARLLDGPEPGLGWREGLGEPD